MAAHRTRAESRVCYAFGAATTAPAVRCDCGEPLWLPEATDATVTDAPGMWRHAGLLPVDSLGGVADAVGDTPLVAPDAVADFAGVDVSLKLEGTRPRGRSRTEGARSPSPPLMPATRAMCARSAPSHTGTWR